MDKHYFFLPAPSPPPVGAAVSSQVEVGEVGATAMKEGAQKLRRDTVDLNRPGESVRPFLSLSSPCQFSL